MKIFLTVDSSPISTSATKFALKSAHAALTRATVVR